MKKRKICALVVSCAMLVSLLPTTIFAEEEDEETETDAVEITEAEPEEETADSADVIIGGGGTVSLVMDDEEETDPEEDAGEAAPEEEPEEDAEDIVYRAESGSVRVEVTAPADALPEDAKLSVERYAKDSANYRDAAEAIDLDEGSDMAALDISFLVDGEEVEPSEPVKVSIDVSDILPEDADASTLEVQHLIETPNNTIKPVVVANESSATEGKIDENKATAEFEVEDFSVFTITWDDGTETTIEVHVYSMNGTSIDEELDSESYTSTSSVITISDLVSHLEQNASYTNIYTYRYATVVYETQQGGGYSSTTIGGQDNSVSSISKSGTTYTVMTSSGTTTVTDPAAIVIHLYYSIPEVTLETDDPYGTTVEFTTSNEYFAGDTSSATYTWALSDDTLGTLTHPTSGQATFTWSDSAQSGNQVTVTVTMTVGEETASDTYTLTYGLEPVTFTVYSQDGTTPQENARVALVDARGNTVATGTTGADGTVTLYAPAGEYTVGVTYVYLVSEAGGGSTSRATAETTITVSDDETATGSVTLGTAVTSGPGGNTSGSNGGGSEPYYYEHIDVKVAMAETSESDVSFSDLDAVYVYDKYGNLLYVSEDINANPGTTDYNVLFDINGNEDQHSIVVSSEDTIVLVYEVKDNETGETSTYTVSYRSGDTYPADEYYPATAVNAYQLYNILYNANYTSQEAFEAAWGPGLAGYNEAGISISGYSYTLIADYLCDTRTISGQAGLDFVIYVQELEATQDDFDFRVAKTVNGVPDTLGSEDIENFTFTLQELDKVQDDGDYTEAIWSTEEGNVLSTDTDTISSFTQNTDGTWSGILDFLGALQYEAEDGTNFYYYILSEETPTTATPTQQYYGLKVTVTYTAATGVATIVVSYCTLGTQDDYPYYRTSGWTGLTAYTDTDDEGDEYTYYSIPFVNTYSTTGFELGKVDENGEALDGAGFTMTTTQIEGEGTTLYFTSETVDGTLVYTLASSTTEGASTEIAITGGGPVSIQGIAAGTYTLTEITTPNGYATVDPFTVTIAEDGTVTVSGTNVSVNNQDTVIVTNLPVTEITVEKEWVDNDDAYETRPESITVTITGSDGNTYTLTLSDENEWSDTVSDLPLYDSEGEEITYTVTEAEIENYEGDVVDNEDGTYTITNTLTGETEISVEKEWVDNDDAYETRPESITVTITGSDGNTYTLTLSDENEWSDTVSDLPLYDSEGEEITYTVTEAEVENYEGDVVDNEDGTYTITNTLTGETEVSVTKTWANDSDNKYETRPESITVTVTGSDGNTYTLTLNEQNSWSDTLSELPLYDSTGTEITYTVAEAAVAGYTTNTGDLVYNEEDGTYSVEITNTLETVDVEGSKTWDDDEDANGNRPTSITITLLADDEELDSVTVTADDDWAWSFTDLPKYQSDGETEVVYTITEDAVTGYDTEVNGYDVTNTTQTTDISVVKAWSDDDNRDGVRPNEVQVQLMANGDSVGTATLNSSNSWSYKWSDLPVYVNGEKVTYTVEEVEIPDEYTASYSSETDEDGNMTFTMVNTHEDALTQITVNKEWQDADNENGTRPDDVTVQLMANGAACGDVVTLDESNGWSYTWEDLYSFEDGELIEYTVEETAVDGYNTEIGDLTPVYDGDNNLTGYTITVTNTRTGETEISVEKEWADDSDNQYETRPDEITVTITGSDGNSYELTLSDDNDWSDTLSELPLYDSNGAEITYEVTEEPVNGYTGGVVDNEDGTFTITNTLETVGVSGSKTWLYDEEDDRPDSITVYVYADGSDTAIASIEVTADDDWTWSITDLPKYNADGEEITYTVKEGEIDGYIPTYDGTDIENALPEVHKYVSDPEFGESTDDDLKEDEAGNHNTLEYKLEADHIGGAHDLVLHDLLDDQLDINSLVIKSVILYEDENDSGRTLEEWTDYTVTKGACTADCGLEDCTFEIHVIDEDVQDLTSDAYLIVIYDIDLYEDVEDFDDSFVDEIINFVGLSFFATYAETDEADTYSYGFDIYKYATDTEDPLEGAEFILSRDGDDGTVYAQFDDPTEDNEYLLTGWTDSEDDATTIVTDSDGNAVVEGLHDGTFTLTETKAPDGYAYTKRDTTIVISVNDDYSEPTITVDGEETDDETAWIANAPADEEEIPEKAVSIDDDNAFFDGDKDVNVGDTLTYEIRYYNHYADEVTVTITDKLDEGLDFVEASDGGVYDEDLRTITWTIENAAGYTWGSVTFTVTVNETARNANEIENTASVKINGSDEQDTNKVENPVPETRDISGSKTWDDDNDKADARPASITVNLYQNGDPYDSKTVTAADGWAWSWTELPRYDEDGNAYAYTIDEDTVEYYTPTYYEGNFNITNTFIGEEGAEHPTSGPDQGGDHPKTGDTSNVGVWLALLIAALACALVGFRMRRRTQR